jgi:hypothetical protein
MVLLIPDRIRRYTIFHGYIRTIFDKISDNWLLSTWLGEKIKESYTVWLMVHKHHHARHKLVLHEYIIIYVLKLQANFTLLSRRDPIKCLSAIEPYSLHIRFVFVTDRLRFCIYIRTLSAPILNKKNMVTNIISLLSIHICSVFTPNSNTPLVAVAYREHKIVFQEHKIITMDPRPSQPWIWWK